MGSVVLAGLSLVTVVVVTAVVAGLLSILGTRTAIGNAETILGAANGVFLVLVYTAIFAVVSRYDPGSAWVRITSIEATGVLVNAAAIAVTGTVADRVTSRALRPVVQRLRPGELSVPTRLVRLSMAGVPILLFALGLVFTARQYGFASYHPSLLLVLAVVALNLNGALARPLRLPEIGLLHARDPTEDERRRIERCYDRFGREPGRIVVSAQEDEVGVAATGLGPFRSVALTEPFLERVDDDELAVVLAQADERARLYQGFYAYPQIIFLIFSFYFLVAFLGNLLLGFRFAVGLLSVLWILGPVELGVALGLSVLGMTVVAWRGRYHAYRADEFAVAQFGADTVGEVYREFGDYLWEGEPGEDKKQFLSPVPKRSVRLARTGVECGDSAAEETTDDRAAGGEAASDEPDGGPPGSSDQEAPDTTESDSEARPDDDSSERDSSWPDPGAE